MTAPFVIFSLPRSRSAWMAAYLTYGDFICGHEELRHMRSLDDIKRWFSQPCIGTVETAGAPFWRLLGDFAPEVRVVVIRRPVGEVVDSLMRLNLGFNRPLLELKMRKLDAKLDQIEARVPCLSVNYADLAKEVVCASVFEFCLPYRHDPDHWRALDTTNIQCDMRAMIRYSQAYCASLEKLAKIAKHQILIDMAVAESHSTEGVTFQTEDFETWFRDGQNLAADHCFSLGEGPDNWKKKNIPQLRKIFNAGQMQIMTARCNGRMFGYLLTMVSLSLEAENRVMATHMAFYADPSFNGLGLKLLRAALRELKSREVTEVFMQDNMRGTGALFKRIGAEERGKIYRLQLKDCA